MADIRGSGLRMKISTQITVAVVGITIITQIVFGGAAHWVVEDNEITARLESQLSIASLIITGLAIFLALALGSHINRRLSEKSVALEHLALYDKLTGLPNRTLLFDRIEQAQARANRADSSFALLVLDLDNFKEINDTLGHHFGDLILIEVSKNLKKSLRGSDSLTRLGGDEFAILLHDTDVDGTNVCVTRIINNLKAPIEAEGTQIECRASIGCAVYPQHGEDPKNLLKHADIAMYQCKQSHSSFVTYDPGHDSYSVRNLSLMNDLRKAVEQDQITVHYQPMIDVNSKITVAIEALARWDHHELGVISPGEFIQIAERIGIIEKLTFSVLNQALQTLDSLIKKGYNLNLSINISSFCLQNSFFPEQLISVLQKAGISPNRIELELTESAVMHNLDSARNILNQLHNAGFIIAIDDFGTGFSSLAYLKELPVDILKIDRSFIFDIDNKKSDAIVRSIIELAHNLDFKVIAEGIETEKTLMHLQEINNDIVQGYLFSRPLPSDEMKQWLEESSWPPALIDTSSIDGRQIDQTTGKTPFKPN